jgi:glycine oxidase
VIGLAIGWRLLQRGEPVTLLERGETGREASHAAAGMLSVANEVHFQEDLNLLLRQESMRLYPEFVSELEGFAGQSVDYRTHGAIAISLHADETAELRNLYEYQLERNLPVRWMSGEEVREREPRLAGFVVAGVLCPMDHQVDNRRLAAALRAAFLKAGGALHEHCPVTRVSLGEGGPPSVETGEREWRSRRVVLAAGAWSGLIPGLEPWLRPLVRPVKGQILALRMPDSSFLTHMVKSPDVYIAPKSDGRLVVGATVEEMGFNRDLTAGAMYELLKGAWRAIPSVYELPVQEMWCGLRPGSRDNAPLLGDTDAPGFFVATGHYRNGIINAPITAKYMSELILDGKRPELLQRLSPRRFASPE